MPYLTDNFDSYTDGDLTGQGSWSGDVSFDVQGTTVQAGTKAISRAGNAGTVSVSKAITAVTGNDIQQFYIRTSNVTDIGGTGVWFYTASGVTIAFRVRIGVTSGAITLYNGAENTVASGLSSNTWYKVDVETDTARNSGNGQVRARVDGGTWSSWFNGENSFSGGIDQITLRGAAGAGTTEYWDSFSDQTPEITFTPQVMIF